MDIPILGQGGSAPVIASNPFSVPIIGKAAPRDDRYAKLSIETGAWLFCSQHGAIAFAKTKEALVNSGVREEHQAHHDRMDRQSDDLMERLRIAEAGRKKMESTTQCQCPCTDHTGCIPEDRTHTVAPDERIVGMCTMLTCKPCQDYWEFRIQELDSLRTIKEWEALDDEYSITDYDGAAQFPGIDVTSRVTHEEYLAFRNACTITEKAKPTEE